MRGGARSIIASETETDNRLTVPLCGIRIECKRVFTAFATVMHIRYMELDSDMRDAFQERERVGHAVRVALP